MEAAAGFGLMVGPPIGSLVYGYFGFSWAFWVFSIMFIINLFMLLPFLPDGLNYDAET